MEFEQIKILIEKGIDQTNQPQVWADLGAGSGAFTQVLATLLKETSRIYAVDKDERLLNQISLRSSVTLIKLHQSMVEPLSFDELLNGIVLANSLHYVQDKVSFISSLKNKLMTNGRMLIIEYDITNGNQWVPYPINFIQLKTLASTTGFENVSKLAEVPSQYHRSIYSAMLS